MQPEYVQADCRLLTGRNIDQTHNTAMRLPTHDGQLAEILVQSHQYAPLGMGPGQDFIITRILGPVTGPNDIVGRGPELGTGLAPNAGVEEHSHLLVSIVSGSIRSWPTCRRA